MISNILAGLKDESEPYRKMVMSGIQKIVSELGSKDLEGRLLELLMDGLHSAFQEQTTEDTALLDGIGIVMNSLGIKCQPFLSDLCSTILWRLNNKSAHVRQQAAELISRIAPVLFECGEEKVLTHLGNVLYESAPTSKVNPECRLKNSLQAFIKYSFSISPSLIPP